MLLLGRSDQRCLVIRSSRLVLTRTILRHLLDRPPALLLLLLSVSFCSTYEVRSGTGNDKSRRLEGPVPTDICKDEMLIQRFHRWFVIIAFDSSRWLGRGFLVELHTLSGRSFCDKPTERRDFARSPLTSGRCFGLRQASRRRMIGDGAPDYSLHGRRWRT